MAVFPIHRLSHHWKSSIKSHLNQDHLSRVLQVSNTNTRYITVSSLLRHPFSTWDNSVCNVLFPSLFNIADEPWLCTGHNHWPEVAQTDRLLVCSIGFGLGTFICIVAYLVTIEASDVTQVLANLIDIGGVDIGSRNTGISTPRLVLPVLLFLFSPRFCEKLWVVGALRSCWWFWAPGLRSLRLRVLYRLSLGLSLGRRGVHRSIALVALLVEGPAGGGLYLGLGLDSGCLFDQGVPTIQVSSFFVDL